MNLRRALRYAVYDWTREMPPATRIVAMTGLFIQGYAIWSGITRSLVWPAIWPHGGWLFVVVIALYFFGYSLQNAALTSEFIRKTQLESEQTAAAQIQRTLQPERIVAPAGYAVETYYKPFRVVGGDYFDAIDLPDGRMLLAIADVSGKGMPAALLAANIQALVRSLGPEAADPAELATRINRHLCRHTPGNRFATAVFAVLDPASGVIVYANAGHNAPMLSAAGSSAALEPTGMALGWFEDAAYDVRTMIMPVGSTLLLFTDGLPDAIGGADPEGRIREALASRRPDALAAVRSLVDPKFNEDDVTVLLVRREGQA